MLAVELKRQIVHIRAEGVFDLTADEENAKNDIGGDDACGDGDPVKRAYKLEGENQDVGPGNLGEGDGVGNRQGSVQHTVGSSKHIVERSDTVVCLLVSHFSRVLRLYSVLTETGLRHSNRQLTVSNNLICVGT